MTTPLRTGEACTSLKAPLMPLLFANAVTRYAKFYADYASNAWTNMTPPQYGIILVSVAVFGWILMKSGSRR